jgi:hypothetical protein
LLSWLRSHGARCLVAFALVGTTAYAHANVGSGHGSAAADRWVPDPALARVASLGFRNAVSDYYWIQALQAVGGSNDPAQRGPLLGKLIDVVTTLDPWVDHPYRFAALWLTDSLASVRKADALLDKGIAHHPDEWRNPFYQGVNRLLYLDEPERAADAIEKAAALPLSPAYLPTLVARLRAGGSGLDAAAVMLNEMREAAADPYERARYEKALDEVETERRARFLDEARAAYWRRHGRDIARVEDLLAGPDPILRALPPELHGWEWTIDTESGRIVSSYYGHRYEPLLHAATRAERDAKQKLDREARSQEALP